MSLDPYQFDELNNRLREQAEATLALAYEQRTANLIAMWTNPTSTLAGAHARHEPSYIGWGVGEETLGSLLIRILERLDVREDGTVA